MSGFCVKECRNIHESLGELNYASLALIVKLHVLTVSSNQNKNFDLIMIWRLCRFQSDAR